jgi:hypothetical protein
VTKVRFGWWWEAVCLFTFFALAGWQLFLRPITGLADNGDFPKVLGQLDICSNAPEPRWFKYVNSPYSIGPECDWDSQLISSEAILAEGIKQSAELRGKQSFSIQWAGGAHLAIVLGAFAILLWGLRESPPLVRYSLPPLAIFIFSDVAYVSYLNSFYMDAASFVFLLLTIALAVAAFLRPRWWVEMALGLAAVLLVTSKTQHAILGIPLALLAVYAGRRNRRWFVSAIVTLAATIAMFALTTAEYKAYPLNNLIFYRLLPESTDRAPLISALGLSHDDLLLEGTHSYSPNAPVQDPKWRDAFVKRESFGKIALYYLHNPSVPLQMLFHDLRDSAPWIRSAELGNYRRKDGFAPGTLARRFAWWSDVRAWAMRVFPEYVVLLYAFAGIFSLACCFRKSLAARWPLYPLVLMLVVSGVVEFCFSSLADCLETERHLFIFQVITEMVILFALAGIVRLLPERKPL